MTSNDLLYEEAVQDALQGVASGIEREETRGYLIDNYPTLSVDEINGALADALKEAHEQGVEREDIDDSWL